LPPAVLPSFPTRRSSDLELEMRVGDQCERGLQRLGDLVEDGVGDADLDIGEAARVLDRRLGAVRAEEDLDQREDEVAVEADDDVDRKSTRLNSSHQIISY